MKNIRKIPIDGIIHFVGIGGIGMCGIATVMHNSGYHVQGSDLCKSYNTDKLLSYGIKIFFGHDISNVRGVSMLVVSSVINTDNVEVQAAISNGIIIMTRTDILSLLIRCYDCSIAISGTHGKTTTTALVSCVLDLVLSPTVINGGVMIDKESSVYVGLGDSIIVEADESDCMFVTLVPDIVVVTNIDNDHLVSYGSFNNLKEAFRQFIVGIPVHGYAVLCIDDSVLYELFTSIGSYNVITYGIVRLADVMALNIRLYADYSVFDVIICNDIVIRDMMLVVPGIHNVVNTLAAIALAYKFNVDVLHMKTALANFSGIKRRLNLVLEYNGALIMEDYAHHPNEVKVTLEAARRMLRCNGRLVVVFQPHRYSRFNDLFRDFLYCFNSADKLYVTDIYAAGESTNNSSILHNWIERINVISGYLETEYIILNDDIRYNLYRYFVYGNVVLFVGAGDISKFVYDTFGVL